MKQAEAVENKHTPEEIKAYPKKRGISGWLLLFVLGTLVLTVVGLVWLFTVVDINQDFNRPWWNWAILGALLLIILLVAKSGSLENYLPGRPRIDYSKMLGNIAWYLVVIIACFFLILFVRKNWIDIVHGGGAHTVVIQQPALPQKIGTKLDWGTNYLVAGERYYFDRNVIFYTHPASPSDTLTQHCFKEGFEGLVYWDVHVGVHNSTIDQATNNDDGSAVGKFYFIPSRSAKVFLSKN